ncbi:MAG: DUF6265 family protein [Rudaea sp.]
MIFRRIALVVLLLCICTATVAQQKPASLERLAWLAGAWHLDDSGQRVDEFWSTPAQDMMIGMSRSVRDGKTTTFEFLRIVAREDGVFYVAQPRGKPPVEFRLESIDAREAIFVNPGHADHLQRIVYRHGPGDTLAARIEGSNAGHAFAEDFAYRRADATRAR